MDVSFFVEHRDGIILSLDLFGTVIFAITGALRGFRARLDLLGVLVLACAVGVGGGMTRDALLGATPVAAFEDGRYLLLCLITGFVFFYLSPHISLRFNLIPVLDAVGLGVFTSIGCEKALLYTQTPIAVVLCGVITAVGGGVIRDVLVMRVPAVLRSDFYATAAAIGGGLFLLLLHFEPSVNYYGRFLIVSSIVLLIRLIAMRYKFHLPISHVLPSHKHRKHHQTIMKE